MRHTLRFGGVDAPRSDHEPAAPPAAVVVVPVKAFDRAKVRLAPALDPPGRAALARAMAERVLHAAAPLAVAVVCEDDEVADWARSHGAAVVWTPGTGLDGAVAAAVDRLAAAGVGRAVVAHADLPFARDLAELAEAGPEEVVLVPDRRRDGTNVASVPTGSGFRFAYGPGSFERHAAEARTRGLTLRVVEVEHLGWDVDEPDDLAAPAHLGALPAPGARP